MVQALQLPWLRVRSLGWPTGWGSQRRGIMGKASALAAIYARLMQGWAPTLAEVAGEYGVCERTTRRYLSDLSGFPWYVALEQDEESGRWRVMETQKESPRG